MQRIRASLPFLAFALLAVLAWLAYLPGLHGNFLFDDFANLPTLGTQGRIDNWPAFWRYITAGKNDPLGRPLTLLTFLLDARDWPADPYPFKRTNLILHLLNGALLYALLAKLGQGLKVAARPARIAALFGCAMWLLHPLLVSTTLYIVQREAMLSATCVMAGLLFWMHGRALLATGNQRRGLCVAILGLGGFTLLAALAKANGILLPFYALLIETIVLAPRWPLPALTTRRAYRVVLWVFAFIPCIAILGYLVRSGWQGMLAGGPIGVRTWSMGQRLLTEPRVLFDYLQLLWMPRPFSSGLFNDQYLASTSLLHPATTLPAMLGVFLLAGLAWRFRRRHPALALAILFYFAGQLLESTSVALELYFEHRNYTPALLMFWPLGLWLSAGDNLKLVRRSLMTLLPLALAWMTHARAELWGNVQTQAILWARINPESPRAQANAADIEMQTGHLPDASRRLQALLAAQPAQAQLAFNLINVHCRMGRLAPGDDKALVGAMRHTSVVGPLLIRWFGQVLPLAVSGQCPGLTVAVLEQVLDAGQNNTHLSAPGTQQDLLYLRGLVALAMQQPTEATSDFVHGLDLQPKPEMALQGAAALGAAGYPAEGLRLLDHYQQMPHEAPAAPGMPALHEWVLARQNYWPHEIAYLRLQLEADAEAKGIAPAHPATHQDTSH
ncbi:tetratricopeptide repeat protein [Rhodanobacter sp. DHB23]|uniref:tetratricopeptide repeat protein n=1 Tax=Rhodanobacter sp. DHB23 TaxID=2775923 RepID=UPI00177AB452|nr:tetratricopeptide repeat protein [Rhodanobacter sp. DHB23]MBD8873116.1 tetratricopeptide repeat protein [Rhodanobacter sp. DHB23]